MDNSSKNKSSSYKSFNRKHREKIFTTLDKIQNNNDHKKFLIYSYKTLFQKSKRINKFLNFRKISFSTLIFLSTFSTFQLTPSNKITHHSKSLCKLEIQALCLPVCLKTLWLSTNIFFLHLALEIRR